MRGMSDHVGNLLLLHGIPALRYKTSQQQNILVLLLTACTSLSGQLAKLGIAYSEVKK